jgi:DNA-binding response OmpR family regulator
MLRHLCQGTTRLMNNKTAKMKILIAEDDAFFEKILEQVLAPFYDLVVTRNGNDAWEHLRRPDAPRLAILDWVMPGLTGPEVCRKVRACPTLAPIYLMLLTAKNNEPDIVAGLRSGADDYITKPPLPAELRARVRIGERVLALQQTVEAQAKLANYQSSSVVTAIRSASPVSISTDLDIDRSDALKNLERGSRRFSELSLGLAHGSMLAKEGRHS